MTTTMSPEQPAPSGRHPVNIGHLVMGMAFVGLVGVWALVQGDVVDGGDIRWLLPVPWVLAGVAGLLVTTLTSRDRRTNRRPGWVEPTAETWTPDIEPHNDNDHDTLSTEEIR